jgi:hypothetical protein
MYNGKTIIDSVTQVGNTLEVIYREESSVMYACYPPRRAPDRVTKVIYGVVDGNLQVIDRLIGTVIQERTIPEQVIFHPKGHCLSCGSNDFETITMGQKLCKVCKCVDYIQE